MNQKESDKYYINVAKLCAQNSYAEKLKVGAIIVKDNQIISDGFNGTPSGLSNECEDKRCMNCLCCNTNASLNINSNCKNCQYLDIHTKPEVLHAESNAILKCAKLIIQAGIKRVVYLESYRKTNGLDLLKCVGIVVEQFNN